MKRVALCVLAFSMCIFAICCGGSRPVPQVTTTEAELAASPAVAGNGYSFQFQATDPTTGALTWAATGLPADGLVLVSAAGSVVGTPAAKANVTFSLTATDASGGTSRPVQFTITVNNPPSPSITTTQAQLGSAPATNGSPYGFQFSAANGLAPLTWSESGALPAGMTFDVAAGALGGTPTATGSFPLAITVTDAAGQSSGPQNFTLTVVNPSAPIINTSPGPPLAVLNQAYSFTFTATNGLAPLTWSETGSLLPGLTFSTGGVLSGTATTTGSFPITVMVGDSLGQNAVPQGFTIQAALGFAATGSMQTPRFDHTATLLNTGEVLVAGGSSKVFLGQFSPEPEPGDALATAELYDLANGTFSSTGSMATARTRQSATLLLDRRVLVAGGEDAAGNVLASAELFDPSKGTFSAAGGSMTTPRIGFTAALLNDGTGRVLLTGGKDSNGNVLATAELFDPSTATFSATTGSMTTPRENQTASLLSNGKVLITGGDNSAGPLNTAELFDPSTQTFTATSGSMTVARSGHTATVLHDGTVLLVSNLTAEIYDPNNDTFTATGSLLPGVGRTGFTATLRNDGTVLVAGGMGNFTCGYRVLHASFATAELFDPATGSFSQLGSMSVRRSSHAAALLANGQVLLSGGLDLTTQFVPMRCPTQQVFVNSSADLFP